MAVNLFIDNAQTLFIILKAKGMTTVTSSADTDTVFLFKSLIFVISRKITEKRMTGYFYVTFILCYIPTLI